MSGISTPARVLLNSWTSFEKGIAGAKGFIHAINSDMHIMAEYATEAIDKKQRIDQVVAKFFGHSGGKSFETFVKSVGVNVDRNEEKRKQTEALYLVLSEELYPTDWSKPCARFVTDELYRYAHYYDVAMEAVAQCVKYGGRHWAYFKAVCEQLYATQQAAEMMEQQEIEGMVLPPDYYEDLSSYIVKTMNVPKEMLLGDIETVKDDKAIGEAHAKRDYEAERIYKIQHPD